jgi:hypothetical protein
LDVPSPRDVPSSNHDFMDGLHFLKVQVFIHEILSIFINKVSFIHPMKTHK